MHDALLMGRMEGRGGLGGQLQQGLRIQGAAQDPAKVTALDQLRGQKGLPFGLSNFEDRGNIRMVELAGGPGLLQKQALVFRVRTLQELERHLPFQAQIHRPPDLAKTTFPERFHQPVGTEGLAGFH